MSHPLYTPELRGLLADGDTDALAALCETLHPAAVAEALDDDFTAEELWGAVGPAPVGTQAAIFEYLPAALQAAMVAGKVVRPQLGALVGRMSHDDRADFLNRQSAGVREALLRVVDEAERRDIATLTRYPADTVGALMTTDYAWLPPTLTAAEAIDQLRQQAPDRETIYYVYILGEVVGRAAGVGPRRLLGVLSLRDLILAPRHTLIQEAMDSGGLVTLTASDPQRRAAELLAQYDFIALPVVDSGGGLVGIVTHDDVIDVITEEATDALQQQGGLSPLGASYLEAPFLSVWRKRVPWLSGLFVLGMGTYFAIDHFEGALRRVPVLTLFIPLMTATGGNSGTQAATLVTRALALGEVTLADWGRIVWTELRMGLALGAALASLAVARAFFVGRENLTTASGDITHLGLGLVFAQVVLALCVIGTLVGALLPLLFRRVGFDPALASSPAVTTALDVIGITVYFAIASFWLF